MLMRFAASLLTRVAKCGWLFSVWAMELCGIMITVLGEVRLEELAPDASPEIAWRNSTAQCMQWRLAEVGHSEFRDSLGTYASVIRGIDGVSRASPSRKSKKKPNMVEERGKADLTNLLAQREK
ncbi:hypothetical protein B0H19DRAFT_1079902 [Mycena capillaripes]|nr:hypothetical protein B0H19DRAFT_1079902 [Mycena capillaripes]